MKFIKRDQRQRSIYDILRKFQALQKKFVKIQLFILLFSLVENKTEAIYPNIHLAFILSWGEILATCELFLIDIKWLEIIVLG